MERATDRFTDGVLVGWFGADNYDAEDGGRISVNDQKTWEVYQSFVEMVGEDPILHFEYYYKYMFTYKGKFKRGTKVHLNFGGDPNDVYHLELTSEGCVETLKDEVIFCW